MREYNVAHIVFSSPLDHPDTEGQGIDRIAWHCELGILAPLRRLVTAGKGVQVMASAAAGRSESRTNTSLTAAKIESGSEASGGVFLFLANEQSGGWVRVLWPTGNSKGERKLNICQHNI